MVKEAEAHAGDDAVRKEKVELHNQADALIYNTEKNLTEHGEHLDAADKTQVEADIAALKEALEGDDIEALKSKIEALSQSAMKLGEAMYKAQQEEGMAGADDASAADPGGAGAANADDATVVDADFEEVEDDKKDKSA